MSEKKSFALRIDSETMKAIEKWSADEFRSVNGQIEWMLNNCLKEAKRIKVKTVQKKQCPNVIEKKDFGLRNFRQGKVCPTAYL